MEEQVLVELVVAQLVLQAAREMVVVAAHKVQVERVATQAVRTELPAPHIWAVEVTMKAAVVVVATTAAVAVETTPVVAVARVMSRY